MQEAEVQKPPALKDAFPDFEEKFRTIQGLLPKAWEAKKRGDLGGLRQQISDGLSWIQQVITTYHTMEEMDKLVKEDTATFAVGNRLGKDDLLLKQAYILYLSLKDLVGN